LPRTGAGFSHVQRLHNPAEFARVFADAERSADRFFTVLGRPNEHPHARLGLTISRRAAKRAIERNRLKRIAREAFRLALELPSWDFVVLAKPLAAQTEPRVLRRSLDEHFERLRNKAVVARDG
jgi:ribonuclease P protein component